MRRTRKQVGPGVVALVAGVTVAGMGEAARATLFLYDTFNYTTTAADPTKGLSGTEGAVMGAGGYTSSNGNLWYPTSTQFDGGPTATYHAVNDAAIVAGDLGYPGLLQDASSTAVSYGGPGYSPKIGFTEILTGTVYYSFVFKVTDLSMPSSPAPAFGGIGLIAGFALGGEAQAENGNPSRVPTLLYAKPTGTTDGSGNRQFTLGVSKSETNPNTSGANPNGAVFGTHVFSENETIFVVGKYEFIESNANSDPNDENDNISTLYINPRPGGLEATAVETLTDSQGADLGLLSQPTQSNIRGVDAFIFRQGGSSTNAPANPSGVLADELRIGTTWGDVTPMALAGDANTDGLITRDDYALVDRGFARYATGLIASGQAGWTDGDFDLDGAVTAADYLLLDQSFAAAGGLSPALLAEREGQFGAEYVARLMASVPEPASAGVAIGGGLIALASRRRRG